MRSIAIALVARLPGGAVLSWRPSCASAAMSLNRPLRSASRMTRRGTRLRGRRRNGIVAAAGAARWSPAWWRWPLRRCRSTGCSARPPATTARRARRRGARPRPRSHLTVASTPTSRRASPGASSRCSATMQVRSARQSARLLPCHQPADHASGGTCRLQRDCPSTAGSYFNKIECFCFTEQTLEAGRERRDAGGFYVDPAIRDDHDLEELDTITLSYTFYPRRRGRRAPVEAPRQRAAVP